MSDIWECVHLCDLKLDGRWARIDGKTLAFFARTVTGRKTFMVDMKTADLYVCNPVQEARGSSACVLVCCGIFVSASSMGAEASDDG